MKSILVTCPPMVRRIHEFEAEFKKLGFSYFAPKVVQTLSPDELKKLLPQYDGWIIGDDPTSFEILKAGREGNLKAAVKWGVGVDNIDFQAFKELGIPIENTPRMFGGEVADVAVGYVIGLARDLFQIDRAVRINGWPKPSGMSLNGKTVAIVGFGDIGQNVAKRLSAFDMIVIAYDPGVQNVPMPNVTLATWPEGLSEADFLVFTCNLTAQNRHMLNESIYPQLKDGVRIVNVARGPLVEEEALIKSLRSGKVHSAALDVFEAEPLPSASRLREFEQVIMGSHNGSNTVEGVRRASYQALKIMDRFLNGVA